MEYLTTGQELIAASTAAPRPECVRRRLFEAARRRVIVTNLHHDRPSDLGPRKFQQKPRRVHHRADTAARQYRTAATRSRPKHLDAPNSRQQPTLRDDGLLACGWFDPAQLVADEVNDEDLAVRVDGDVHGRLQMPAARDHV